MNGKGRKPIFRALGEEITIPAPARVLHKLEKATELRASKWKDKSYQPLVRFVNVASLQQLKGDFRGLRCTQLEAVWSPTLEHCMAKQCCGKGQLLARIYGQDIGVEVKQL